MNQTLIIAKRELQSFFDSLTGYILLVLFFGFVGFMTWVYGGYDIFFISSASLDTFFGLSFWALFFLIPGITMKLLAEEQKTGTLELLLTKAVTDRQVIYGKFLATLVLIGLALFLTLPYVFSVASLGDLDVGTTISGYLALFLMSAGYAAIGLWCSSITNNQIVALLLAYFVGIFFHWVFGLLTGLGGLSGEIFEAISMSDHYNNMRRGVIDLKDLIYFASLIYLALYLAQLSLTKRKLAH